LQFFQTTALAFAVASQLRQTPVKSSGFPARAWMMKKRLLNYSTVSSAVMMAAVVKKIENNSFISVP
jgi:hypothetical protein